MQIEDLLKDIGLEEYIEIFKDDGIDDLETLKEYSDEELLDLNIKKGHVKKIRKELANLKENETPLKTNSIKYPNNQSPNNMVTYIAHPWDEYVREEHPNVKLHWLIDTAEVVVRWICALLLSEIKYSNNGMLPEAIQKKFKENILRPTLGVWLNLVEELSKNDIKTPIIKNLFNFYKEQINIDGIFPENGDESNSLLKLRNRIAHGGGTTQSQAKEFLNNFEPKLISLITSVNELLADAKLYGNFDNKCFYLHGLTPKELEYKLTTQGPFLEYKDVKLPLWPLVEFDKIRQVDNNGVLQESSNITAQTYLRSDKQGIQYIPIGAEESYSITNRQEEFESIFGLTKKEDTSKIVKRYEYHHDEFLKEARYLKEELIGRVSEIKTIKNWIKEANAFDDKKRCALIYGGPGLGKSLLMASVAYDMSNNSIHHTFYYRFRGGDSRNSKYWFVKLLNDSLYSWDKLSQIDEKEPIKTVNIDDIQKELFERISNIPKIEMFKNKIGKDEYEDVKPTLRLFIDGLDEITSQDSSMLRLIEKLQEDGVVTLIASRLENDVTKLKEFHWIKPLEFDKTYEGLPPKSNIDIRAMLLEGISKAQRKELILKDENSNDTYYNPIVEAIASKADGLPLYINLLIEDINNHKYSIFDSNKLPNGLTNYYNELVDRMGISSVKEYLTKLVTLLSLTKEPLDIQSISLYLVDLEDAKDRETLIKDVILAAGTLLKTTTTKEDTIGYTLYHQSFREFILKAQNNNKHALYYTLKDMKKALYSKSELWDKLTSSSFKNHIFRNGNYYTSQWQENGVELVKQRLTNLEYLLDRTKSLATDELNNLLKEYEEIQTELPKEEKEEFEIWNSFFREKVHIITKVDEELWRPYKSLFQLAYEDGDNSPLTKQADRLIEEEKIDFNWLKRLNRPEEFYRTGLLKVLEGHADSVKGAIELRDGRILSYSDDNTLILWSVEGEELKILERHKNRINGAIELKDGRILSYSDDNTLRLWSSEGEYLKVLEEHRDSINGAIELKDGRILSYSNDTNLILWDSEGKKLKVLEGHKNRINGALELKDGRILSYSDDKTLILWSLEGEELKVLDKHTEVVLGVLELRDERILSYSLDETIIMWDSNGKKLEVLDEDESPFHGALEESLILGGYKASFRGALELKDGRIVSYSWGKNLRIWSSEGKELVVLKGHRNMVKGTIELNDGKILSYSEDKTLILWSSEGKELEILEGHSKSVNSALELKDGKVLSSSSDKTLRIWSMKERSKKIKGHSNFISGLLELKDGRIVSYDLSTENRT